MGTMTETNGEPPGLTARRNPHLRWQGRKNQGVKRRHKDAELWLSQVLGDYWSQVRLRMRPNDDPRSISVIKGSWAQEPGNRPDLVFDDRNRTTRAWREMGIMCCQVAENT